MEEELLLSLLEKNALILSKANTTDIKAAKKRAWTEIQKRFEEKNIAVNVDQLKKKWMNIKTRVLEKVRKRKQTGGGPTIQFTSNDEKVLDLLGEGNPKVCKVPGAWSTSRCDATPSESMVTPAKRIVASLENDTDDVEQLTISPPPPSSSRPSCMPPSKKLKKGK